MPDLVEETNGRLTGVDNARYLTTKNFQHECFRSLEMHFRLSRLLKGSEADQFSKNDLTFIQEEFVLELGRGTKIKTDAGRGQIHSRADNVWNNIAVDLSADHRDRFFLALISVLEESKANWEKINYETFYKKARKLCGKDFPIPVEITPYCVDVVVLIQRHLKELTKRGRLKTIVEVKGDLDEVTDILHKELLSLEKGCGILNPQTKEKIVPLRILKGQSNDQISRADLEKILEKLESFILDSSRKSNNLYTIQQQQGGHVHLDLEGEVQRLKWENSRLTDQLKKQEQLHSYEKGEFSKQILNVTGILTKSQVENNELRERYEIVTQKLHRQNDEIQKLILESANKNCTKFQSEITAIQKSHEETIQKFISKFEPVADACTQIQTRNEELSRRLEERPQLVLLQVEQTHCMSDANQTEATISDGQQQILTDETLLPQPEPSDEDIIGQMNNYSPRDRTWNEDGNIPNYEYDGFGNSIIGENEETAVPNQFHEGAHETAGDLTPAVLEDEEMKNLVRIFMAAISKAGDLTPPVLEDEKMENLPSTSGTNKRKREATNEVEDGRDSETAPTDLGTKKKRDNESELYRISEELNCTKEISAQFLTQPQDTEITEEANKNLLEDVSTLKRELEYKNEQINQLKVTITKLEEKLTENGKTNEANKILEENRARLERELVVKNDQVDQLKETITKLEEKLTENGKTNEANKSKITDRQNRRWTHAENLTVLNYLLETVKSGSKIEKPNAPKYYTNMIRECNLSPEITHNLLRNKVQNFRRALEKWKKDKTKECSYREYLEQIWPEEEPTSTSGNQKAVSEEISAPSTAPCEE